jgi:hypothetical protein
MVRQHESTLSTSDRGAADKFLTAAVQYLHRLGDSAGAPHTPLLQAAACLFRCVVPGPSPVEPHPSAVLALLPPGQRPRGEEAQMAAATAAARVQVLDTDAAGTLGAIIECVSVDMWTG